MLEEIAELESTDVMLELFGFSFLFHILVLQFRKVSYRCRVEETKLGDVLLWLVVNSGAPDLANEGLYFCLVIGYDRPLRIRETFYSLLDVFEKLLF